MPQNEPPTPEASSLSVREYARLAGFSEKTVRRYLKSGRLTKYQPGGENCRVSIPASELAATTKQPTDGSSPPRSDAAAADPPPAKSKPAAKRPLPKPSWMR
jgi:hypothetical protein